MITERKARDLGLLAPGERYVLTEEEVRRANTLKRDLLLLINEIGKVQTGGPVDAKWVFDAAKKLGEAALGVVDWSLGDEQWHEAVDAVVALAKKQLAADVREEVSSNDDIPF